MLKEQFNDLNIRKVLTKSSRSIIYLLSDGRVFKRFCFKEIERYEKYNISLEEKILVGEKLKTSKEFYEPLSAVYRKNRLIGYTMKFNNGKRFDKYIDLLSYRRKLNNLHFILIFFTELEYIVKKGYELGLVFPDLCTPSNIFISKMGYISLTDYDGFQIDDYFSFSVSSAINNKNKIFKPKFYSNDLFTKELDKYSLMVLFLEFITSLDISLIDTEFENDKGLLSVRSLARYINLDNEEIIAMIEDTLSVDNEGVYVSVVANAIASKYDLFIYKEDGKYNKILIKK